MKKWAKRGLAIIFTAIFVISIAYNVTLTNKNQQLNSHIHDFEVQCTNLQNEKMELEEEITRICQEYEFQQMNLKLLMGEYIPELFGE